MENMCFFTMFRQQFSQPKSKEGVRVPELDSTWQPLNLGSSHCKKLKD